MATSRKLIMKTSAVEGNKITCIFFCVGPLGLAGFRGCFFGEVYQTRYSPNLKRDTKLTSGPVVRRESAIAWCVFDLIAIRELDSTVL